MVNPNMNTINVNTMNKGTMIQMKQMNYNKIDAYQKNKVNSSSNEDLVLMLYDGAIKFLKKSLIHLESNKLDKVSENLIKAQKIISELDSNLDKSIQVSVEFSKYYDVIQRTLIEANLTKNEKYINDSIELIDFMRNIWIELLEK